MRFDVGIIRFRFATEDTASWTGLRWVGLRSVQCAYPMLEREVKRLLVALPIVLGPKRLGAEGTLVWHRSSWNGSFFCASLFVRASSTPLVRNVQGAL